MKATEPAYAYITKADFDEAVKQPWTVSTCVVAQAAKRLNLPSAYVLAYNANKGQAVMNAFDDACRNRTRKELARIRASLPVKVRVNLDME